MDHRLKDLSDAVIAGGKERCEALTRELLSAGTDPKTILDGGLVPGMDVVGARFRDNIIFVPEVLISARAMKGSLAILEPLLSAANVKEIGTFVIGTVKGDIHDIGKNIVGMMLRGAGFKVVDLGIDTRAEKFIAAVRKEQAQIVGMSALLTTTMTGMKEVIDRFEQEGLRKKIKFMVGGAPLTDQYAKEIGADGYAPDAASAADKFKAFLRA